MTSDEITPTTEPGPTTIAAASPDAGVVSPTSATSATGEVPISNKTLDSAELLFALSAYCYIIASKIGYDALNTLDERLVRVQELTGVSPTSEVTELSAESNELETELEDSITLAKALGENPIEPSWEDIDEDGAGQSDTTISAS